ncbi:EcoAI/FtnUII family type I restriction enzme subunit R [Hymenobacter psychrotolerans]|uniref:Type I restriction enzyme, R subunit n=1 Tax=Hymenobacter psychrotolerans DSM 18569 TaxID=1121959 RepID=A0A1M6PMY4_9BACT|nr:DEAD/DEAH box helicase family protein [Hymenobacter psychrotolerans]SHK09314.1 type I restriction enzyme, R subunit [Hymenobacter psychrotolerans DSM 18569]
MLSKKNLSERDICTKYITPAIETAGWNRFSQYLEEVSFTDGKIYVKGKLTARGKQKRADYILYYKPNIPIAIIEAKDNQHAVGAGMMQALDYAHILDIPFVFSSNGDGFLFHDRTATAGTVETELALADFPSPAALWARYKQAKGLTSPVAARLAEQDYYLDGSGRRPRYYQQIAINRTVEAIARGQNRVLLVMATGTGKTYTAFQIVHRLWKSGAKKRILFLADRNALLDQTKKGDFKHFRDKMHVIEKHQVEKSYEIYLALYQGLTGSEEERNIYKQFSPGFFDLIVVDECHRGSASEDSSWRDILTYFSGATQIGLTATPRETEDSKNVEYFGNALYTYSLRQGINDGFLAPYRVVRIATNIDLDGWRPDDGKTDTRGELVEDRVYNLKDFDRKLVVAERTELVARKITEFLRGHNRMAKTIVFCVDIDHAERMRSALANQNPDLVREDHRYVMRITGDNELGKQQLENFTDPASKYPVIATTSELMTTGVDAQTCQVIVLDSNISSMTKFKQIIGRGTRINEDYGKLFFTILDFRQATNLFADPAFDGEPERVKEVPEGQDLSNLEKEEAADDTADIIDEVSGEVVEFPEPEPPVAEEPKIRYPTDPDDEDPDDTDPGGPGLKRRKIYVNGVDVTVLLEREVVFDEHGKPVTVKLTDYARQKVQEHFATLDDFLSTWHGSDRKAAILQELEEQGVPVAPLRAAVGPDVDLFDLLCHVAFDQPPLTRQERARNVRKRDYFTRYGPQARRVLEALTDKYADQGLDDLANVKLLTATPFTQLGSPLEIFREFGGKPQYLQAVHELERELYRQA